MAADDTLRRSLAELGSEVTVQKVGAVAMAVEDASDAPATFAQAVSTLSTTLSSAPDAARCIAVLYAIDASLKRCKAVVNAAAPSVSAALMPAVRTAYSRLPPALRPKVLKTLQTWIDCNLLLADTRALLAALPPAVPPATGAPPHPMHHAAAHAPPSKRPRTEGGYMMAGPVHSTPAYATGYYASSGYPPAAVGGAYAVPPAAQYASGVYAAPSYAASHVDPRHGAAPAPAYGVAAAVDPRMHTYGTPHGYTGAPVASSVSAASMSAPPAAYSPEQEHTYLSSAALSMGSLDTNASKLLIAAGALPPTPAQESSVAGAGSGGARTTGLKLVARQWYAPLPKWAPAHLHTIPSVAEMATHAATTTDGTHSSGAKAANGDATAQSPSSSSLLRSASAGSGTGSTSPTSKTPAFVPLPPGAGVEVYCAACGDSISRVWHERTEEWMLEAATRRPDGTIVHSACA